MNNKPDGDKKTCWANDALGSGSKPFCSGWTSTSYVKYEIVKHSTEENRKLFN